MNDRYNSQYLIKDGKPWFPVMGEMHYSRFRETFWEESLRKIKAGGIQIVASYVIWIHHEEGEGEFDFTGCRDLGNFVRLCQKTGLKLFLRLGPWAHGEVRNGGFPDWLLKKQIPLRCNDQSYLEYVEIFWRKVYGQIEGFLHQDGGPIIGVQIENEYGHAGGLRGEEGEAHMRALTTLAKKIGFDVPLYTATGWGGAVTGGLLPVMGCYCDAPWDQRICEIEANENYVFSSRRNDAGIASDYQIEDSLSFDAGKYPYLLAELGGGLQPTHHRRPVIQGADIGAMSLCKLGSGAALLGYYMYHGGSNPKGRYSSLQESRATGYPSDLPEINYDFQAPIRQYGQISDVYKEIKLLSLFLNDFGNEMAVLKEEIEHQELSPEDMDTLRIAWRHDDEHGYVFFNNYQRHRQMKDHEAVLIGRCKEKADFGKVSIRSGEYGFFPYHMRIQGKELITAAASPLCILKGESETCVFYGDWTPDFQWKDSLPAEVLHISRQDALNAWKVTLDRDYLILSEQYVWEEAGDLRITGGRHTKIRSYPELKVIPKQFVRTGKENDFICYERNVKGRESAVRFHEVLAEEAYRIYEVEIVYGENIEDCLISLEYAGDSVQICCEGEKIEDHFYAGQAVEMSMRYFDFPASLTVKVNVLRRTDRIYLEEWPKMTEGKICRLWNVIVREEFR